MPTNVQVPGLGESVSEAVLIKWHKNDGELVKTDEPLCELETEKANVDVPSPGTGVIKRSVTEGTKVRIGQTIATIDADAKPSASPVASPLQRAGPGASKPSQATTGKTASPPAEAGSPKQSGAEEKLSPAVRRMVEENQLDTSKITGSGPGGRITKEDVLKHMDGKSEADAPTAVATPERASDLDFAAATPIVETAAPTTRAEGAGQRRVPMSKIRKKIAERLVNAQQTAAILTTFNEIDLHNIIELRTKFKERFEKVHGVGLGFMSFFARAVVLALKEFERVNAQIDGDDVVYHDYVHLGIAVSTDRGLAVPVLRNVDKMSFAKIEMEIKRLAAATRDGKLIASRTQRRHLHHHQRRRVRLAALDAHPQSPAVRNPGHARDPEAADRRGRSGCHPPDDVCGAELRPSARGRAGIGELFGEIEGIAGGSGEVDVGDLRN